MTTIQDLYEKLDTARRLGDPVPPETRLIVSVPDPEYAGNEIEAEISKIKIYRTNTGRRIVEILINLPPCFELK